MHQQLVEYPGWYVSEASMRGKVPCLIAYGLGVISLPTHVPVVVSVFDYLANPDNMGRFAV